MLYPVNFSPSIKCLLINSVFPDSSFCLSYNDMCGIVKYAILSNWLPSVSHMHLRFCHILISSYITCFYCCIIFHCTVVFYFVNSSLERHLAYSCSLEFRNKVEIYTCVNISYQISWERCRNVISGSYGKTNFVKNYQVIFQRGLMPLQQWLRLLALKPL